MTARSRTLLSAGAVVWSVVVWVALWSDLTLANVLWGIVVGLVFLRLVPVATETDAARISIPASVRWAGHLVWSLVQSSAVVAWEVVTPRNRLNQGIVAIPLRTTSDIVTTVVANSITLTPGAMTLEVARHPTVLYVHVMHLRSIEEVREDVLHLESLVLRMFPDADAAEDVPDLKTMEDQ